MSFIRKLWKGRESSRRRQNHEYVGINDDSMSGTDPETDQSDAGGGSPVKEIQKKSGHRRCSRTSSGGRSTTPSPCNSPKHGRTTMTMELRSSESRHVAQVLPGLLLGSIEFAQDLQALQRNHVTHVLNITVEVENFFPDRFEYRRIAITDMPSIQLGQYFDEALQFIAESRASGGCTLVHCYYGASRSASFVIAYLVRNERMRYKEALEYLQLLRPDVHPNDGFERQLRLFAES